MKKVKDAVLCYVSGNTAYFTTQPLDKQWGDDWDDVPYEHNAGIPYEPGKCDIDAGNEWLIVPVMFLGDFSQPCEGHLNSPYSVQSINKDGVPWLRYTPSSVDQRTGRTVAFPGMTLSQFCEAVELYGGITKSPVYFPTVIQALSGSIGAYKRCIESGNTEWEHKHRKVIEEINRDYLPHGSGVDAGCEVDLDMSRENKVVICTSFHHMNDVGYYDGWTDHTIVVRPAFQGIDVQVKGRDRNDIKDYLGGLFYDCLQSRYGG